MKKMIVSSLLAAALVPLTASALSVTLGEQDFPDGSEINLTQFESLSTGEPAPFDKFYGSDPSGPNFNKSFSFSYAPQSFLSATLFFGLYDGDGDEVGLQLASFSLDGLDLSAAMSPLIENTKHVTANVVVFALPSSALALLADGAATFNLALQGPSKMGELPYNGAGLDFARLEAREGQGVPDLGSSAPLLALAMGALFCLRRKTV